MLNLFDPTDLLNPFAYDKWYIGIIVAPLIWAFILVFWAFWVINRLGARIGGFIVEPLFYISNRAKKWLSKIKG